MLEKSQEELEQMAAAINTLAAFCGKRDLPRLSGRSCAGIAAFPGRTA